MQEAARRGLPDDRVEPAGSQVPQLFELTVDLLLNSVGGHADEARPGTTGLDDFADLESPFPPALINLPKGEFNAFVVHRQPSGVRLRDQAKPEQRAATVQNRPVLKLTNDFAAGNYLQRNRSTWRALAGWRHFMPRYFFDIKDGHSLVDPTGRTE